MANRTLEKPVNAITKQNKSHETDMNSEFFVRPATMQDDEQLVNMIAKTMPCAGIKLSFERYPSYLKASHVHYNQPEAMVAVSKTDPNTVLAFFNVGTRHCYINGSIKSLRYVGDFRVNDFKHLYLTKLLMEFLRSTYPTDELYQSIMLSDHSTLLKTLSDKNSGAPKRFTADSIETHTLTGFKFKKQLSPNLSITTMSASDISEVNRFVAHMSDYYNFLPAYDFNDLLKGDAYWRGLNLADFLVFRRGGQIVGLCGLWDQTIFKQIRIGHYGAAVSWLKPLYNYWAKHNKQVQLPNKGSVYKCLMLHSALCNPYDTDLFDSMLRVAHQTAIKKNFKAICFTLAKNDPRLDCSEQFVSQKICASHGFHSFEGNPLTQFDSKRISYLECGRI